MPGARYVRYIAFGVVCVFIILLITSSGPSVAGGSVYSRYEQIKESWRPRLGGSSRDQNILGPYRKNDPDLDKQADIDKEAEREASRRPAEAPGESKWNPIPVIKSGTAPGPRQNATFVTLARNQDVWEISKSIRSVEDRFNHRYNYDWVFLNDVPFDDEFKRITTNLCSGRTRYGVIPKEHWSFPKWIDLKKAENVRKVMHEKKIIYGDSISYRHMCRYESGFFFRHPIMNEYAYYWRVEPSIELFCDVNYDTFEYMHKHDKKYSFTISLYEYRATIPTLWDSTKTFMEEHPEHIAADNSIDFLSNDGGKTYNYCHFWSNFEIGSLEWLRSDAYLDFFDRLDKDGGFFYERWGDAPVHSIAAGLTLNKDQIHFFDDVAYYHIPFTHCPNSAKTRDDNKCHCNPKDNFDWNGYSCTARFYDINGMKKPEGFGKGKGKPN